MNVYGYTAVIWKETDGYVSKCPELGVASCGQSFEEASDNLREAVELYLVNAKELGIIEEISESLETKDKFTGHFEAIIS
jgi:predicted RNase H-like HicB family nuclease